VSIVNTGDLLTAETGALFFPFHRDIEDSEEKAEKSSDNEKEKPTEQEEEKKEEKPAKPSEEKKEDEKKE